jgi:LuxR family maltose regulon positive regulatory protein
LQTLKEMSSGRQHSHPSLGYLYYVLSQILLAWNELEEAERQLKLGIDLMAQDIPGEMLIMSTSLLPALQLAQGKREEAVRLAEECLQRIEAYSLPYIPAMVKANLVRFWMRVGDRDRIEEWLSNCGLTPGGPIRCVHEVEYIALAKVLMWQGRAAEAQKVLAQLHDLAQRQGRIGKLFYILALQALALKQSNDLDQALKALEASLKLAQSEGYMRPYVEEGRPMEELLQFGAERGIWHQAYLDGYANRLLKAIQQDRALLEGTAQPQEK